MILTTTPRSWTNESTIKYDQLGFVKINCLSDEIKHDLFQSINYENKSIDLFRLIIYPMRSNVLAFLTEFNCKFESQNESIQVVFYHLNLEPCHTFASTKDFQTYKYFNSKTFIPFIALLRIAYLSSMYIRSRLVFCGKNLPKCPRCPFTSNRF